MPKEKKSNKKINQDLVNISKKFVRHASQLSEDVFKSKIIEGWNIPKDEKSFPALELTRHYILESAWKDYLYQIMHIINEINHAVQLPQVPDKTSVFDDELNFLFNREYICFTAHIDYEKSDYDAKDIPTLIYNDTAEPSLKIMVSNTALITQIAITGMLKALKLIKAGADINKYSPFYGDNPLLLAVTKGWNHLMDEEPEPEDITPEIPNQEKIIEALLARDDLDIHAVNATNGMTALHIACLRGDEPTLIELLLQRGVKPDSEDCLGKTASDYLDSSYAKAKETIIQLTDGDLFGSHETLKPNQSTMATLPTEAERARNVLLIKKIFNRVLHDNVEDQPLKRPKF
jgi:hypothetical protein